MTDYEFYKQLKLYNAEFVAIINDDVAISITSESFFEIKNASEINNLSIFHSLRLIGYFQFQKDIITYKVYSLQLINKFILKCDFKQRCFNHLSSIFKELNIIPNFNIQNCSNELSTTLSTLLNHDYMLQGITDAIINKKTVTFISKQIKTNKIVKIEFSCDGKSCNYSCKNPETKIDWELNSK